MDQVKFVGLDEAVFKKAEKDLRGGNPFAYSSAALYFFLDGKGVDESNPNTFLALCARNGFDSDGAAKAIWRRLPQRQRQEVHNFLSGWLKNFLSGWLKLAPEPREEIRNFLANQHELPLWRKRIMFGLLKKICTI